MWCVIIQILVAKAGSVFIILYYIERIGEDLKKIKVLCPNCKNKEGHLLDKGQADEVRWYDITCTHCSLQWVHEVRLKK